MLADALIAALAIILVVVVVRDYRRMGRRPPPCPPPAKRVRGRDGWRWADEAWEQVWAGRRATPIHAEHVPPAEHIRAEHIL